MSKPEKYPPRRYVMKKPEGASILGMATSYIGPMHELERFDEYISVEEHQALMAEERAKAYEDAAYHIDQLEETTRGYMAKSDFKQMAKEIRKAAREEKK